MYRTQEHVTHREGVGLDATQRMRELVLISYFTDNHTTRCKTKRGEAPCLTEPGG